MPYKCKTCGSLEVYHHCIVRRPDVAVRKPSTIKVAVTAQLRRAVELKSEERPEAGHRYLFRIFLYDKSTGVMSPPSRRSATISLMEDEEE